MEWTTIIVIILGITQSVSVLLLIGAGGHADAQNKELSMLERYKSEHANLRPRFEELQSRTYHLEHVLRSYTQTLRHIGVPFGASDLVPGNYFYDLNPQFTHINNKRGIVITEDPKGVITTSVIIIYDDGRKTLTDIGWLSQSELYAKIKDSYIRVEKFM